METEILDDSGPAVKYSSGWQKAGGYREYNNTTSCTNQTRTTATVSFVGVQITVFGTIGPRVGLVSPVSNYSIDGGTPTTYAAGQDQNVYYNTKFYLSPTLPQGPHTLVITNLLNSDTLYLDCFHVLKPDTNPSSGSSSMVNLTLTSTPNLSSMSTVSSTSTQISPNITTSAGPSHSSSNTAAIIGSVFGALFLVIVGVTIVTFHRSRNKRKLEHMIFPEVKQDPDTQYDTQPDFDTALGQPTVSTQEPIPPPGHVAAQSIHRGAFAAELPSLLAYQSQPYPYDGYAPY